MSLERGADGLGFGLAIALLFGGQHVDQLPPAAHQVGQFCGMRLGWRIGLGLHDLSEAQDHGGVNRVGLGQLPAGPRQLAHAARVDPAQGDATRPKLSRQHLRMAAGRLAHHMRRLHLGKPFHQPGHPGLAVG